MIRLTLIDRVRRGEINFERFVEILAMRGFITEQSNDERCGFGSTAMEKARQHDFDALFALLLPSVLNNILLSCAATDEGGLSGAFSYALFNSNVIDRKEVLDILIDENRKTAEWWQDNM